MGGQEKREAERKARRPLFFKEDVAGLLQEELLREGIKLSRSICWMIVKKVIFVLAELARERWVSLSGIGTFKVVNSRMSIDRGLPPKKFKYKASVAINRAINEGRTLLKTELTISEMVDQLRGEDMTIDTYRLLKKKKEERHSRILNTDGRTPEGLRVEELLDDYILEDDSGDDSSFT